MAGRGVAGDEVIKVLGTWSSSFAIRVRLALTLKGLSHEYAEEDLMNKSSLLHASNPVRKQVPVLLHGGKPVCESPVILQYIDEAFAGAAPSILPADPHERAAARFWTAYIDDKFFPSLRALGETVEEADKAEAARQVFAAMENLEDAFEACSKGNAFFGGDSPGYVDVALGAFLGWIKAAEAVAGVAVLGARTPMLAAWAERFRALDAAKELIPSVESLRESSAGRGRLPWTLLLPRSPQIDEP